MNRLKIDGQVMCAKCKKPVERLELSENINEYVFFAHCHGMRDSCILKKTDVMHASSIDGATAFNNEPSIGAKK